MLAPYNRRPWKLTASRAGPHRVLAQHGNVVEYEELVIGKTREVNLRRLHKFNLGSDVDPVEVAHRHEQGFSTVKQVNGHRYTNEDPPTLELFIESLGWDLECDFTWEPIDNVREVHIVQAYLQEHSLG